MLRCASAALGGLALTAVLAGAPGAAAAVDVTTYHGDAMRTGWNQHETALTVAAVGGAGFGLLHSTVLDEQVDAQPLIVTGLTLKGVKGTRDVAYVVTEANTVYAVDADSGAVLLSRNLGAAAPLPSGCTNNSATVGIGSTPVIDRNSKTLYLITYNYDSDSGDVAFNLHALALGSLADKAGSPVAIRASHPLSDGTVYPFNPISSRQRAALLETNGAIYAAFASYCDLNGNTSRGWLLGWNATSLKPLSHGELTNQFAASQSPGNLFLTSIWMSGYGVAADGTGNLFFATGNSDYWETGSPPFNPADLAESVVKVPASLKTVTSYFTPQTLLKLERGDHDFGAGGVLLLPNQTGKYPRLAVAGGKDGNFYLLNRDSLGGFTQGGPDQALGIYSQGGCWCGPAYFVGADQVPRVVSSGGSTLVTWKVETSSTAASLVRDQESMSLYPGPATVQDGGAFTSISSNKTKSGTAIIWTVARPTDADPAYVTLEAFDAAHLAAPIFAAVAGSWPNSQANANIVPTVANGKVYVASYKNLAIFGLGATPGAQVTPSAATAAAVPGRQLYGTVQAIEGTSLTLLTRSGEAVAVDASPAVKAHQSGLLRVGGTVLVRGRYRPDGVLAADSIQRAKSAVKGWGPDR